MSVDPARLSEALEKAMYQFWANGIEATPYADLVQVTGLSRKALYQVWPEKIALVHATLDLYHDMVLSTVEGLFDAPGPAAIDAFWDVIGAAAVEGWPGCYLLRSAAGEMRKDERVRQIYSAHLSAIQRGLYRSLVGRHADPAGASWQAAGIMTLLTSLAAQGMPRAALEPVLAAGRAATAA